MVNGKVVSSVFEFQDGTFRRIAEVPGFLRVARIPARERPARSGLRSGSSMTGRPNSTSGRTGSITPATSCQLPQGWACTAGPLRTSENASPLLVALDDDDHLLVYSGESLIWKSAEQYPVVDKLCVSAGRRDRCSAPEQGEHDGQGPAGAAPGQAACRGHERRRQGRDRSARRTSRDAFIGGFSGAELHGSRLDRSAARSGLEHQGHPGSGVSISGSAQDGPGAGSVPW